MSEERCAVLIGSGLVSRSWAVLFSKAGVPVFIYNSNEDSLNACFESIGKSELGEQIKGRIKPVKMLGEDVLRDALIVQECVPEDLEIKKKAWTHLDEVLRKCSYKKDLVLGSSSSNLSVEKFCEELSCREQCINTHPVNPPDCIPLVEIVPANFTNSAIVSKAKEIMANIGMSPVVLNRAVDGFLLNRLQFALLAEAFRLVQNGVCSPEDVDTAVTAGLARRWSFIGPLATIDLNHGGGVKGYCQQYGKAILEVVSQQDNSTQWKPETIEEIDAAMRSFNGPLTTLKERMEWRDGRLQRFKEFLRKENERDTAEANQQIKKQRTKR
mmetsp:Transcript_13263/g.21615  ORF Transcript_13263/g.21615 Transcript_13263/m.21615 type:complete len:327 (-) Transcript_13263:2417-3397(-)|eukprot:CAMPEP_0203766756 /NCGR_PEP_ID=MMETSP0099_2-20121227/601_1 /ASSEMBLY_ACC=CAM_ASM_000209 /TAXON_ID=96639 /ORGANISM=" , Strain NY0313808BC1" /LENGTH=326 /DNA_ID=CAMNT_0050663155 /DNA_START=105 /DNA_END=1085 /DNA_ORIENTATION=+